MDTRSISPLRAPTPHSHIELPIVRAQRAEYEGVEEFEHVKSSNKIKQTFQNLVTSANYLYYSSVSFYLAHIFSLISIAASAMKVIQQISILSSTLSSGFSLIFESLHLKTAVKLSHSPFLLYSQLPNSDKNKKTEDLPTLFAEFCTEHNLLTPDCLDGNRSLDPKIKALKSMIHGEALTALSDALNTSSTLNLAELSQILHTQVQKRKLFLTISLITLAIFFIGATMTFIAFTSPVTIPFMIPFVLWWGGWGLNIITNFAAKGYLAKKGWEFSLADACPDFLIYSANKVNQAANFTFKQASRGISSLASALKPSKKTAQIRFRKVITV